MQTAASIPTEHAKASAFKDIALAQIKSGDNSGALCSLDNSLKSIHSMPRSWVRSDILWRISKAQAMAGNVHSALRTSKAIHLAGLQDSALRDITKYQADMGDIPGAMTTSAHFTGSAFPSPYYYISLAHAYARDIDSALKTAGKLDVESREHALIGIACAQTHFGDILGARYTLARNGNTDSTSRGLERMAMVRVDHGDLEGAAHIALTIPHQQQRVIPFNKIAIAMIKQGMDDSALIFAKSIKRRLARNQTLRTIGRTQAEKDHWHEALQWAEKLTSPLEKANALLGIAEGLISLTTKS